MKGVSRSIPAKPRPVDFFNNQGDHMVALYGASGLSTSFIRRQTGLSPSQITYRLKKAGMTLENGTSRMDFRNGTSPFFKSYWEAVQPAMDKELISFLKKNL